MEKINKICVLGLGYIGLPTAAMFASHGVLTVGVDINQRVCDTINNGKIHISEPHLEDYVNEAVSSQNLYAKAVPEPADAFIIAVPTPIKTGKLEPDIDFIISAAKSLAPVLKSSNIVILESTSPVGTTQIIEKTIAAIRPDLIFPTDAKGDIDVHIAFCPERVLPGKIMEELVYNDRIIGGLSVACASKARDIYKIFVKGDCIISSDTRVAELSKLVENSFRDVNIAFANELSLICDKLDVNVWELIKLANRHPRVNILQPGPGVGGHCIAIDPWFIVASAPEEANLITCARNVNLYKTIWVLDKINDGMIKISNEMNIPIKNVNIAIYGLTFKAGVDDLRESPSMEIAKKISNNYEQDIYVVDPYVKEIKDPNCKNLKLTTFTEASKNAHLNVLLVDHQEFKCVKPPNGLIIDTRGIWKS